MQLPRSPSLLDSAGLHRRNWKPGSNGGSMRLSLRQGVGLFPKIHDPSCGFPSLLPLAVCFLATGGRACLLVRARSGEGSAALVAGGSPVACRASDDPAALRAVVASRYLSSQEFQMKVETLAATAVVLFALAGVASADKPEGTPAPVRLEPETGTDLIAECRDFGVREFEVLTDFVVDGQSTIFFDSAGNPDYARVHLTFVDFYYNSETGEGFTEHEHSNTLLDLPSGEEVTSSGVSYRVTVPGEGVVLLEAGRLEFNEAGEIVFVAGPHQVLSQDTDKLCEALAGS